MRDKAGTGEPSTTSPDGTGGVRVLIVWHSRTGASRALARAAARGAGRSARLRRADRVRSADLLAAAGYLFIAPENLGALSGAMKEMFDRTYYDVLVQVEGRPYATIIAAGSGGDGAQAQLDRIVTGWRLRRVAPPLIVSTQAQSAEAIWAVKQVAASALAEARSLGALLAQGLAAGVF